MHLDLNKVKDILRFIEICMNQADPTWLEYMSDEDRAFIKRFVLASGSLKAMAETYGVSYPTVRLRLDRLIQKIQLVDDQMVSSAFEKILRAKYAEGAIDLQTLKTLLKAHQKELDKQDSDKEGVGDETVRVRR